MSKVEKHPDGCWLWTAACFGNGYGAFRTPPGEEGRAHRWAYAYFVGPIPEGLHVLHRCDIRRCVNPDHLWVGTDADNQADMTQKGRGRYGERNGIGHLTADDVRAIRHEYQPKVGGRPKGKGLRAEIASRYGISEQTIYRIVTRQVWRHVD